MSICKGWQQDKDFKKCFEKSVDGFSTLSPAVKMSQQVLGAGRNEALAQQHIIIIITILSQQCYHNNSPKGSLYSVQFTYIHCTVHVSLICREPEFINA
jgi:hypothetical protein